MATSKHTPGPWQKERFIIYKNDITIADCSSTQIPIEEIKANVNVIQYSLDVLEALKTILEDDHLQVATWRLEKALSAIAKAETT